MALKLSHLCSCLCVVHIIHINYCEYLLAYLYLKMNVILLNGLTAKSVGIWLEVSFSDHKVQLQSRLIRVCDSLSDGINTVFQILPSQIRVEWITITKSLRAVV